MVKFKTYPEFEKDYKEKGFINKVSTRYYPLKKINSKQLWHYYLQYLRKLDKKYGGSTYKTLMGGQSEDSKLSAFVRKRDGGCRLLKVLTVDERIEWNENHNGLGSILDAAHVFGKGAFPWMRFDEKNVVTLNRFSHNCLDNGKSPISGKMIDCEQQTMWWKRIVGNDWDYLHKRSFERN